MKKFFENDIGQRKALRNIFIFLVFLLIFTLVARGTNGATLTLVDLASPTRATIVGAITGTATVSTREIFEVYAPAEGLTILEMYTEAGRSLYIGEAIARFDMDGLSETILRETASLEQLLFNLERLGQTDTADASALDSARRSLTRAREDYDAAYNQSMEDIAEALNNYEEALEAVADETDASSLQSAIRGYQRALEDYHGTLRQNENDIAAAEEALADAIAAQSETADNSSVQSAQRALQRRQEDYNTAVRQNNENIEAARLAIDERYYEYYEAMVAYSSDPNDATYNALIDAQRRIAAAEETHRNLIDNTDSALLNARRNLEDAQTALAQAQENYERGVRQSQEALEADIERAENALESARSRAAENMLSAERRLEDAEVSLAQAERNYERGITQADEAVFSEIERTRAAITTAQNRADDNISAARRRVEDAEVSLSSAQQNYNRSVQQSRETEAQNRINAVTTQLDIERQESVLETLTDAMELLSVTDGILYSEYDCIIYNALSENNVTGSQPLISFKDSSLGHEAQMTISADDAEYLYIGDECEVSTGGGNMYYVPTVFGYISAISRPDENDNVTVTIDLPERDWNEYQRVDVEIVLSSGTYDFSVPISALRSDNAGYFVYTVETQNTVLGMQNVVTRADVTLNASDGNYASVSGAVGRNSRVITGSNKPVTAGDRVRVRSE